MLVLALRTGAGSILSFLRPLGNPASPATRPVSDRTLVLVPNSTLMDSHQSDLAEEMNRKGWATVCWSTECAVLFASLEQGNCD